MEPVPLEAKVRQAKGVAIIDLQGELNATAEQALEAAYREAATDDPSAIVLDFGGVPYINSTGIAVIVGLLARARNDGRTVSAQGLSEHYRELFRITRLSEVLHIIPDGEGVATGAPTPEL
ncbi:MAG: STAS domain-containing protein [Thermomicrobiales bacterium]